MELLTAPRTDELSVLLEQINVRSVVYCLSDLGEPWGLRIDGSATAKFHLVLDGRATLTLDEPGAAPAELSAGDLALLAHGSGHLIQDDRDSPARPLEHILAELPAEAAERLAYGGDGPRTSLLCGGFALASGLPENLLDLLPPLLVLDTASTGISRWLEPTLALLRNETAADAPGGPAMLAKLADVFLAEIVRRYLSSLDALTFSVPRRRGRPFGGLRAHAVAGAAGRPLDRRRPGPQGGPVADGVRRAVPRPGRRAADELPGPGAPRLRRRIPVGYGQDRTGDRPHGRVRERGLAVQGVPAGVRPRAR